MLITYNHERYVAEALDSILSQVRDFTIEINVIDDASTDRTQEIVRCYARKFSDVPINCYFNNFNVGHIYTQLNTIRGFRTLHGEYFAILEGDDYWTDRNKLARQVAFLEQHSAYVACAHWTYHVYEDGRPSDHFFPFKEFGRNTATFADTVRMAGVYHLSSIVYRNVFRLNPPLAFSDPYSCEITINMVYSSFGDFYCFEQYTSAHRVHSKGLFFNRSATDIWVFHLHGYRRFALYLGMQHWPLFARAIHHFANYVLRAPERGVVLDRKTHNLFWYHRAVLAPFITVCDVRAYFIQILSTKSMALLRLKAKVFVATRWPAILIAYRRFYGQPGSELRENFRFSARIVDLTRSRIVRIKVLVAARWPWTLRTFHWLRSVAKRPFI
jgi:glycosyltransferase involved in cell wall biosynthesis